MDKPKAGLRQRIFAWALARFNTRYERFAAKYKQRLFRDLTGTVLEIGPGTGANLRYLNPAKVSWIGVEPNPFMQAYLHEEANRLGMPIEIRMPTGETLPVADESVDAVISTLVLCCVNSQRCALQEVLRVLKPGGRLLFIEHVAAPRGSWLRRIQNLLTPLWKRLGDGCHPNRETCVEVDRAGFDCSLVMLHFGWNFGSLRFGVVEQRRGRSQDCLPAGRGLSWAKIAVRLGVEEGTVYRAAHTYVVESRFRTSAISASEAMNRET